MRTRIIAIAILIVAALGVIVAARRAAIHPAPESDGRVDVVATFYPLAEFARKVGGDRVRVTTITPAGVEPHEFEPSPQAIARITGADILLVNGGGIDAWVRALAPSLRGVRVITMAERMGALLPPAEEGDAFDEHFWLSPTLAMREVEEIRDAFIAVDAAHADAYRARADAYRAELGALDAEYAAGLRSCAIRTAITSHAAFAYLAHAYGFEQLAITGLSPDDEPAAGRLVKLAWEARSRGVRYIFFETLVSPALAETLARTVGAQTLVFNPIEGLTDAELAAGADYRSIMRANLTNLRTALACL